jgi:hypothetical protein
VLDENVVILDHRHANSIPFELVVSAALPGRKNCGGGGQIVFQIFTTIM